MKIVGLRTSIWQNKFRLFYLITLIPLVVILAVFFTLLFLNNGVIDNNFWNSFLGYNLFGLPIVTLWVVIGVIIQKRIIFKFTGAREITRKENPRVYNIVENLCISKGIPTPKIGIIYDDHLNAFATGWKKDNSWIVFSKGLLENLNDAEVRAVAGHELTHILNGDVKNMVIINVFIGAISTIGYFLLKIGTSSRRSSSSNSNKGNPLAIIGLVLYLLGIILLPLVNLAISRKKEYLADAGSVELTGGDSYSMISALEKISKHSYIKTASAGGSSIASMFISSPNLKKVYKKTSSFFSTHPTLEERVSMLRIY